MKESFIIIGGDKRQEYLKNILSEKFQVVRHITHPADICELENIGKYSNIILPVPTSKDKETIFCSNKNLKIRLNDIYENITEKQRVFGCSLPSERGFRTYDFMKDKTFKLVNARLTAQGALRLMLENTDDYIPLKKALILGFGDVAETLAEILSKLGIEVYIAARNKSQLLKASFCGYKTIKHTSAGSCIFIFDYIFGTIPANILRSENVKSMKESAVYFELASSPFTADKEHFAIHGKKHIDGSALPGRFLPLGSAELIADFILMNL